MTDRERFHAVFEGRCPDRLPVVEWATWWDLTLARWRQEGLPVDLSPGFALDRHLGLDTWWQVWTQAVHWECPWKPAHHGAGILSSAPDYDAVEPFVGRWPVLAEQFAPAFAHQRREGVAVWFTFPGFFWGARTILGIERHLYAFADEAELLHRINDRLATWMLSFLDELDHYGRPDFMTFAEDLSGNLGPMVSRKAFDAILLPYYRRVIPALRQRGIRVLVDSDGDLSLCASWFAEAGIEGLLPLEARAGNDLAALRRDQPGLRLVGGFDKLVITKGVAAVEAEFERILPVMRGGGFLPSCDHQTPPDASLADYRAYLECYRHYAELAVATAVR